MAHEQNSEGGWPGGWLIAAVAGVIAAILARWIGDLGMAAAVLVGVFVFLVFGVMLGMFWSTPAVAGGHDDHGHGHDDGHGHAPVAPVAVMAPVAAAAPPVVDVVAPAAVDVASGEAVKPEGLAAPRGGAGDDLKTIEGIGPVLEKLCHDMGIFHFDQIADWGAPEIAWMDGNLKGFRGRVTRDKWVAQAKLIGAVGIEEFRRRAATNDY